MTISGCHHISNLSVIDLLHSPPSYVVVARKASRSEMEIMSRTEIKRKTPRLIRGIR